MRGSPPCRARPRDASVSKLAHPVTPSNWGTWSARIRSESQFSGGRLSGVSHGDTPIRPRVLKVAFDSLSGTRECQDPGLESVITEIGEPNLSGELRLTEESVLGSPRVAPRLYSLAFWPILR